MKREILFRGQRADNKEWIEGSFVQENNVCSIIDYANDKTDTYSWFDVIPKTVGQFTGRIYINRKLFQGDLLKRKGKIYEVIYDEYMCAFMLKCESIHKKYYFDHFDIYGFDYVGNIFDNPNLLNP